MQSPRPSTATESDPADPVRTEEDFALNQQTRSTFEL